MGNMLAAKASILSGTSGFHHSVPLLVEEFVFVVA
jgi:hypothetical protein